MCTNEIKDKLKLHQIEIDQIDLADKQCSCIIKGWSCCQRILVNHILMFGLAWCLITAQIQFSLIKKIKIGRTEHLLTPHPLCPTTSYFCLTTLPTSLKVEVICVSPRIMFLLYKDEGLREKKYIFKSAVVAISYLVYYDTLYNMRQILLKNATITLS